MPLMVIVLDAHEAVTPAGNPIGVPMPVAPVVVCVITGLKAVLMHSVGVEDAADTVVVPHSHVIVEFAVIVKVQVLAVPLAGTLPVPVHPMQQYPA